MLFNKISADFVLCDDTFRKWDNCGYQGKRRGEIGSKMEDIANKSSGIRSSLSTVTCSGLRCILTYPNIMGLLSPGSISTIG